MGMKCVAAVLVLLLSSLARAWDIHIPNPPEPTAAEVLAATGVDVNDPAAIEKKLRELMIDGAIDRWMPELNDAEYARMKQALWDRAAQDVPEAHRSGWLPVHKYLPEFQKQLIEARPKHEARQVDVLLRRLGAVGTDPAKAAGFAGFAKTDTGRWKAYASSIEILARVDLDTAAQAAKDMSLVYPQLLRDLPPDRAGELAKRYLASIALNPAPSLEVQLWLAYSLSHTDPAAAAKIFERGLTSFDPALRVLAGRGLSRLTDIPSGFAFTAPPAESDQPRKAWLAAIHPRPPVAFAFPDPSSLPLLYEHRGTRLDLIWINHNAEITRRLDDIWPTTRVILSDGSAYARLGENGHALIATDGTPLARILLPFPPNVPTDVAEHGGLIMCGQQYVAGSRGIGEYAPDGRCLWSLPQPARDITYVGQGRFAIVHFGKCAVIDRRGDIVWRVPAAIDTRRVRLIDPDTMMILGKNDIVVHHHTKGRQLQLKGFTSVSEVRYHPTQPWQVFDAGSRVIVVSPATDDRKPLDIRWNNESPTHWSKWLPARQYQPD